MISDRGVKTTGKGTNSHPPQVQFISELALLRTGVGITNSEKMKKEKKNNFLLWCL